MAGSNSHKTILTLSVNELNAPIKRHRLANWIKVKTLWCAVYRRHISHAKTHIDLKGWKIYQANGEQRKAGVTILVSDKMDFKSTMIKRDKGIA